MTIVSKIKNSSQWWHITHMADMGDISNVVVGLAISVFLAVVI